jgi:hypothetical protein
MKIEKQRKIIFESAALLNIIAGNGELQCGQLAEIHSWLCGFRCCHSRLISSELILNWIFIHHHKETFKELRWHFWRIPFFLNQRIPCWHQRCRNYLELKAAKKNRYIISLFSKSASLSQQATWRNKFFRFFSGSQIEKIFESGAWEFSGSVEALLK